MPTTPAIQYQVQDHSPRTLLALYRELLYPRLIEEKMLKLLRGGKISKWFAGIGQEAISVGAARALLADEWIMPLHRNLGVFTQRGVPLRRLFAQWQGKPDGFTKGRDRSFHFGIEEYRICGMISHLGPQLSLAAGTAMAHRLREEGRVSLAFTGEGGTSEGEFHEALNTAAVWDLPVIFLIENNGYGLSTPVSEQYRCDQLSQRAAGYGMLGLTIDGNNVLEVYDTLRHLADDMRRHPRPVLVEAMTFRMRGHEEASGTKYVPQELFDTWEARDPIRSYEYFLLEEGYLDQAQLETTHQELKAHIETEIKAGIAMPRPSPEVSSELADVYAEPPSPTRVTPSKHTQTLRFVDAVSDGLRAALHRFPELIVMGQDVAEYGGVFKITEGFAQTFGKSRIRNTPLCESAILGIGLGLSLEGFKSVIEMQFSDFVSCGFNQIVNNLAKIHYRWGPKADVVVRMPTGAGVGAGPFHSQSTEGWFMQTPGLKVVYPATPEDAKGLLAAAVADPNPVMYFEHKALYRRLSAPVPEGYYETPIGQARLVSKGDEVLIVTYGMGVVWAQEAIAALEANDRIAVLDLRSLLPWDRDMVLEWTRRTGKVLVLQEAPLTAGPAAEIAAWIGEHAFEALDGPVMRVGALDTPVPFASELEAQYLPPARLNAALRRLLDY
jgi:2-oxoisovalerate dehydrogenase E1 component